MRTHNEATQASLTPMMALKILHEGNQRFVNNLKINRNLLQQVNETKGGQFPFATILSCIDSRTSAELIFDQGLGDVFSVRVAGNVLNRDILGSMEFATKVAGSKVVMVLGHTRCGAIKGACAGVKLGNLTHLLEKIEPIVELERQIYADTDVTPEALVEIVAERNVREVVKQIPDRSPILRELVESGEIIVAGGMYNVATGVVEFFSDEGSRSPDSEMLSEMPAIIDNGTSVAA
jgi:carbonic anhydrase